MPRAPMLVVLLGSFSGFGCTESAKVSEHKATAHVERLARLADDDVEEVRRGLPRGAKSLGQLWGGQGTRSRATGLRATP